MAALLIGYDRVSTREQNPAAQEAELRAAGASRVFVDHGVPSRVKDRPQWLACLDSLRPGDTLVIRALDRIAGSEQMAIELIRDLARRGVRLRSLTEPFLDVDTTTPMGEAIVGIMGSGSVERGDDPGEHQAWPGARPRPGPRQRPAFGDDTRAQCWPPHGARPSGSTTRSRACRHDAERRAR